MKPEIALSIVFTIVLTGEAIAEFAAQNPGTISAIAIAAFSAMVIRSVKMSSKTKRQGGPFL